MKHFSIIGLGLAVLAFIHQFTMNIYPFQLIANFSFVTALFAILGLLVGGLRKHLILIFTSLFSIVLLGPNLFQSLQNPSFSKVNSNLTLIQANVYHHNQTIGDCLKILTEKDADLISIQELNAAWSSSISKWIKPIYPYFHEVYQDSCCYGIGLYSKYPLVLSESIEIEGVTTIDAVLNVNGNKLRVISQHTLPPAFPNRTESRNIQISALAQLVHGSAEPVVALGDLNVVPWDPVFQEYLKESGTVRVNRGFQATYPTNFGIPLIPIDHITITNDLVPINCESFSIPGSDHRGLVAGFAFKD